VPDVLPGFDAPSVIAQGGLGTTYRAYDRARQREVAVKVVSSRPGGISERFKALASRVRLQHSWILSVLEVVERDGNWLIVSEFIEGQTLSALLKAGPPLSVKESTLLVYRLATALAYAQEQGLVYDDLSPWSVIIATDGTPHLVDEFAAPGPIDVPRVSGTRGYMPPERLDGSGGLDGSGNVYSLGVMFYQLLTGRLPFGGGLRKRIEAALRGQPVPPRRLNPEVSPALEAVCLKAMARRPEDRHATAAQLAEELLPMLGGNPQATAPNLPPDPKSKKGGGRHMGFWK
jgi:serine/threonine protein kinase